MKPTYGHTHTHRHTHTHTHFLSLPCQFVQVYADELDVKVHDMVDVIGVYVVDPAPPSSLTPESVLVMAN